MPVENPISILIADDHTMVLDGMVMLITSDSSCQVVARADNGQGAIDLFRKHRPDVTILDLQMPKMGGIQAVLEIRKISPNAKIIILSGYEQEEEIYQAFQAGVMAYVSKDTSYVDLINIIKAVYSGRRVISPEVSEKYMTRIARPVLSDREIEVLKLIVTGKSNSEIAAMLTLAEGTVKIHVHNILEKLDVPDRTTAAIQALKRGIVRLS